MENTAKRTSKQDAHRDLEEKTLGAYLEPVQQGATEFHEIREQVESCDVANVIHSAKITRLGAIHINKAWSLIDKCTSVVSKSKIQENSQGGEGVRNISNAIGDAKAKALTGTQQTEVAKEK